MINLFVIDVAIVKRVFFFFDSAFPAIFVAKLFTKFFRFRTRTRYFVKNLNFENRSRFVIVTSITNNLIAEFRTE